jgi:hypothetical protein
MALYQRGRIWYADYYANGERFQESTGTAKRREAEKFLALRISEVQRGVFVKPVNTTLPELGERYIEYAKLHKRSWKRDVQMLSRSFQKYANVLGRYSIFIEECSAW